MAILTQGAKNKVDVISETALALGWTHDGLYKNHTGKIRRSDDGLIAFLDKDERICGIFKEYIEILKLSGTRQRFYNRDVEQPWRIKNAKDYEDC